MSASLDDIINKLGFGKFSLKLLFVIGILWASDASELNLVSLISPRLRCEWKLSSWETGLLSSSVFAGTGLGAIYTGWMADIYGRKKGMIVGAIFTVYFGLLTPISPNFAWFLILRFFVGIGLSSVLVSPSYVAEFISMKYRGKMVISLNIFYAVGSIFTSVMALFLMNIAGWRLFLLSTIVPGIFFLILSPWLPESFRYLQNTGEYDKLIKVLHRISIGNKTPIRCSIDIECKSRTERGDISILFTKEYRLKMAVMTFIGVSSYYGYFGLVMLNTELLQSGDLCHLNKTAKLKQCYELKDKDYVQNIIVAASEIPGVLLPMFAVDVIGRKPYVFISFVISGVGFACLNFCLSGITLTILMCALRILLVGLSQMAVLMAAEMFPTIVRTSALGIFNAVVKWSLIGVSFMVQTLLHISFFWTITIFVVLYFLSAALVFLLPETKDKALINR